MSSYLAFSPLPAKAGGYFLLHWPGSCLHRTLSGILPDLLAEGSRTLCTRFLPSPHPISGVKKWIAHSEGFAKGEVHVTREALDALGGPRAVSLLPVGVSRVEGVFEKDDIVRIVAPDGRPVGAGKVSCDSTTARRNIGRRGARALIHYDYLYLD